MVNVSAEFKSAMKQPVKEIQAFIDCGGNSITDSDDLISFKVSCVSGLCKAAMRKLEAKYLGVRDLLGQWVNVGFGVRLPNGEFEYINFGSFQVTELTHSKDTDTTTIVGYDKMINSMVPYSELNIEYPINLLDYTRLLCTACGLELGNVYFGNNLLKNITSYLWRDNAGGVAEVADDYIKVVMPETPTEYSGVYATAVKDSLTSLVGRKVTYSFYAKADAERTIMFQSAGEEGYHYIDLTTEWQRFYFVVDNFEYVSPTFYCGNTLDKTPYYIKDIMIEETSVLTEYKTFNTMNDWPITATTDEEGNVIDLWKNIDGITYRDIFVQIAQATGSTCIIGADDKVYFKPLTDTGEVLTYDNMFKLKLENIYGEINSVVLARTAGEDNVFLMDETSVATYGLTEYRIENNEIIDKDRENAITPIFEALSGISYYPFEATTEGLGWYEIGDNVTIIEVTNDGTEKRYNTSIFNYSITVDGSIKETLKATAETKTQTQYQYATTITKQLKNTELIVDKQNQTITGLVYDVREEGGLVNEQFTKVQQDINGIKHSVQTSGGNNLLKDSVMFAEDVKGAESAWELSADGTLTKQNDEESTSYGGVSGHSFTLSGKTAKQTVYVKPYTDEESVTHYTFSTKIKKDIFGTCYVKLYNEDPEDVHIIEIPEGESAFYKDYEIKGIVPKMNYYIVEFYGSTDSNATFTDNMLSVGEYKSQWTQANGEVMNTEVNININGVLVKSNRHDGSYTVMSPVEFAGYANVGGTVKEVFSLNDDVTYARKLKAEEEMEMQPIKVVPITEGELIGWAFVPST